MLVLSNEERSSMYVANKDGDNIPPCRTLYTNIKIRRHFSSPSNTHFLLRVPKHEHSNNSNRNIALQ